MNDQEIRDFYATTLSRLAVGPGALADIDALENSCNETIFEDPLKMYVSGQLPNPINLIEEEEMEDTDDNIIDEDQNDIVEEETEDLNNTINHESVNPGFRDNDNIDIDGTAATSPLRSFTQNIRNHLGLSFMLNETVQKVKVSISYGLYSTEEFPEFKLKCTLQEWETLNSLFNRRKVEVEEQIRENPDANINPLQNWLENYSEDKFNLADGILILTEEGKSWKNNFRDINVSVNRFSRYLIGNNNDNLEEITMANRVKYLFAISAFKREQKEKCVEIDININTDLYELRIDEGVTLLCKVYQSRGRRIMRVLLRNDKEASRRPKWNRTLFQVKLLVEQFDDKNDAIAIPAYDRFVNQDNLSQESQILNYQYRDNHAYASGSNVSVDWNSDHTQIWTTFLPAETIKDQSVNMRTDEYQFDESILYLKNISIWTTLDDNEIIAGLNSIANQYESWIKNTQIIEHNLENIRQAINGPQLMHLHRLRENITYLNDNLNAMRAFKMANTAMFLQMIVSRDERFKNGDGDQQIYNNLTFFQNFGINNQEENIPKYRPFQLAFLLMNIRSVFEQEFNDSIDLIWFKTGGGKTEAYLALTALTIIQRRMREENNGVSVIMRYTLRMLASQQFERASYLIFSLEFLRRKNEELPEEFQGMLGNQPITSGMWVGKNVTPNRVEELNENGSLWQKIYNYNNNGNNANRNNAGNVEEIKRINPHPIQRCPWCGSPLLRNPAAQRGLIKGYLPSGHLTCLNRNCMFGTNNARMPVVYIDELIYNNPPTLLFSTVDKFAQFSWKSDSGRLLNNPDLIIQDELHLISGPLGSMVSMYENIIDKVIASRRPQHPEHSGIKIVASTATTRNTENLIRQLYGRETHIFPPMGISADDNYYACVPDNQEGKRKYIGIIPTNGQPSATTELRILTFLFYAKMELLSNHYEEMIGNAGNNGTFNLPGELDYYWTFLCYYNSLKDLGASLSRVSQDLYERFRAVFSRYGLDERVNFSLRDLAYRTNEFTSRVGGSEIRNIIDRAETRVELRRNGNNYFVQNQSLDIALASNMISVGIDISRFNLMFFLGQPRSFAEYIQSSSRAGRLKHGLIVNLFNPIRSRELSLYENYRSYHQSYFRYVEPLSATPNTANVIKRLVKSLAIAYWMHINNRNAPNQVIQGDRDNVIIWLNDIIANQREDLRIIIQNEVNSVYEERGAHNNWNSLCNRFDIMRSLRDVSDETAIQYSN